MNTMGEVASVFLYLGCYMVSAWYMSRSRIIEEKRIDLSFIIAVLIPVLLAANRFYVGTDYERYFITYINLSRYSLTSYITREFALEGSPFGLWLIAKIAGQFNSYKLYFGLLAGVIYVPAALVIKKYFPKELCFLGILLFLTGEFTTGLNISKQVAAVSILMFGMQYVHDRKLWKFVLILLCSWCFHPSALIAAPIYFLWKPFGAPISFKRVVFILGCIAFINVLPQFLTMIGGRFESYTVYTDEISNRSFFLSAAWMAFFYIMRNRYTKVDHRNDLYITMILIGLILHVSGFSSPFVKRMAMYYTFPQMFLIFQIPELYHESDKPLFKIMVFIYTIAKFIVYFYIFKFAGVIPFQF